MGSLREVANGAERQGIETYEIPDTTLEKAGSEQGVSDHQITHIECRKSLPKSGPNTFQDEDSNDKNVHGQGAVDKLCFAVNYNVPSNICVDGSLLLIAGQISGLRVGHEAVVHNIRDEILYASGHDVLAHFRLIPMCPKNINVLADSVTQSRPIKCSVIVPGIAMLR
ncbi:hypothetical protein K469DRAFT_751899 [Zopfia rhizophila CBS 207.26]|uniref:Uncharacterized protein n=1 Tax=Zopfia rhizophila CBS 207.26 TaxID=1314779 RepID=A0A6A6DSZ6_9PEZI|nr:hypothetical protein K469DRAFT_751899 [Zopfia rhizophila CBS 207.26]